MSFFFKFCFLYLVQRRPLPQSGMAHVFREYLLQTVQEQEIACCCRKILCSIWRLSRRAYINPRNYPGVEHNRVCVAQTGKLTGGKHLELENWFKNEGWKVLKLGKFHRSGSKREKVSVFWRTRAVATLVLWSNKKIRMWNRYAMKLDWVLCWLHSAFIARMYFLKSQ